MSDKPIDGYGYWDTHPGFPVVDWQYEVANDDTRLGYWQWVRMKITDIEDDECQT